MGAAHRVEGAVRICLLREWKKTVESAKERAYCVLGKHLEQTICGETEPKNSELQG